MSRPNSPKEYQKILAELRATMLGVSDKINDAVKLMLTQGLDKALKEVYAKRAELKEKRGPGGDFNHRNRP